MKSNSKIKILEIINEKQRVRPHDLRKYLKITPAAVHRHLLSLLHENKIEKMGTPPLVYYRLTPPKKIIDEQKLPDGLVEFINKNYLYITPEGKFLEGIKGFKEWTFQTKQEKQLGFLANEYQKYRQEADRFYKGQSWIDAIEKFKQTFSQVYLDEIVYEDFYSLPKFGKTKLGQLVLHAKQSQNTKLINHLAVKSKNLLNQAIKTYRLNAIAWVPHSIPRKIPFLKEYKNSLALELPTIQLVKMYSGEIPIAQKSLSKLEERITNAKETIWIKDEEIPYKRVLIVDDAVGSGATLNEIAKKLREKKVSYIVGYVLVGSYKGFEVIKEV